MNNNEQDLFMRDNNLINSNQSPNFMGVRYEEETSNNYNDNIIDSESDFFKAFNEKISLCDAQNRDDITEINYDHLYHQEKNQNNQRSNQNTANLIQDEEYEQNNIRANESDFVQKMDNNNEEKNEEPEKDEENGNNISKKNSDVNIIKIEKDDGKFINKKYTGKKIKREEENDDKLLAKNNINNSNNSYKKKIYFILKE